jgi:hypothetical protein
VTASLGRKPPPMTLLSQSLALLRRARALLRELEAEGPAAVGEPSPPAELPAEPQALPSARHLRLAWSSASAKELSAAAEDRDIPITADVEWPSLSQVLALSRAAEARVPGPLAPAAEPFLAGQGARVYSLEVWRRTHPKRVA